MRPCARFVTFGTVLLTLVGFVTAGCGDAAHPFGGEGTGGGSPTATGGHAETGGTSGLGGGGSGGSLAGSGGGGPAGGNLGSGGGSIGATGGGPGSGGRPGSGGGGATGVGGAGTGGRGGTGTGGGNGGSGSGSGGRVGTGGTLGSGGLGSGGLPGSGGSSAGGGGAGGSTASACDTLATSYSNELPAAKKCSTITRGSCSIQVASSLGCGGCVTYVDDDTRLKEVAAKWQSLGCDKVIRLCPLIACLNVTGAVCKGAAATDTTGSCSDTVGVLATQ